MSVPRWVYRFRGYLVSPPMILAVFCHHLETEGDFVWSFGIFLFIAGVALRIWAQQHLHYRLKSHKTLTMTGPYLFVRNPIYIGNTLILVGATVVSELLWLVPLTLFYCVSHLFSCRPLRGSPSPEQIRGALSRAISRRFHDGFRGFPAPRRWGSLINTSCRLSLPSFTVFFCCCLLF